MFSGMSEIIADKHRIDELEKQVQTLKYQLEEARFLVKILREQVPIKLLPVGVDPAIEEW